MQLSPEQQKAIEEQKQQCIFCKIIKGEVPSKKVFEDDLFISILDINPSTKGHMLFMPKEHYPISPLIPTDTFKKMGVMIKEMANVCHEGLVSLGSTIFIANGAAAGQQSQHFMLHVIPRDENDGLSCFDIPKNEIPKEEIEKIYSDLKKNLGMMMQNHMARMGKEVPKEITDEHLVGVIEMNKPLLDTVLKEPEKFKQMALGHPQLAELFKGKDIDKVIEQVRKKHKKKEEKEAEIVEEKEEPKEEKKKKEEGTSLDDISKLFK